jgi:hypothetical protein
MCFIFLLNIQGTLVSQPIAIFIFCTFKPFDKHRTTNMVFYKILKNILTYILFFVL